MEESESESVMAPLMPRVARGKLALQQAGTSKPTKPSTCLRSDKTTAQPGIKIRGKIQRADQPIPCGMGCASPTPHKTAKTFLTCPVNAPSLVGARTPAPGNDGG